MHRIADYKQAVSFCSECGIQGSFRAYSTSPAVALPLQRSAEGEPPTTPRHMGVCCCILRSTAGWWRPLKSRGHST